MENLKVFRVSQHLSITTYYVCNGRHHWKIEYNTVLRGVTDTIKSECDEICKTKRCLGLHQFIRSAIKGYEASEDLVRKFSGK
jgi:hypothetical protein